jgi:hypothetical protein
VQIPLQKYQLLVIVVLYFKAILHYSAFYEQNRRCKLLHKDSRLLTDSAVRIAQVVYCILQFLILKLSQYANSSKSDASDSYWETTVQNSGQNADYSEAVDVWLSSVPPGDR